MKLGDTDRTLIIRAESFSAGKPYVGRVTLNGKPLSDLQLSYEQIMAGGELVFEMIDQPSSLL